MQAHLDFLGFSRDFKPNAKMKVIKKIILELLLISVCHCIVFPAKSFTFNLDFHKDSDKLPVSSRIERSAQMPKINFRANCTCGMRPLRRFKIVGGQQAEETSWPWAVPILYMADSKPWQFCGSSLINTQYLLTASHCAEEMMKKGVHNYQAFLGINAISDPTAIRANISEVKKHPNFNSTTLENDIALIKLTMPVVISGRVHPVCLKQAASPYVGLTGVVVGWGSLREGGKGVDKLREVKIQVINNVDCATNYSAANLKITGQMMCASLPSKDSCHGDSGGPLVIWNPKSKIFCQIGIVSFGLKCGSSFYPGIYSRVKSFIKWIQSNTQDASFCQKSF